jgi:hypothetical protein
MLPGDGARAAVRQAVDDAGEIWDCQRDLDLDGVALVLDRLSRQGLYAVVSAALACCADRPALEYLRWFDDLYDARRAREAVTPRRSHAAA